MRKLNTKPIHALLTRLSEAFLLYTGLTFLAESTSEVTAILSAFAIFWVMTDWAIWFYKSVIQPSATQIAKQNK